MDDAFLLEVPAATEDGFVIDIDPTEDATTIRRRDYAESVKKNARHYLRSGGEDDSEHQYGRGMTKYGHVGLTPYEEVFAKAWQTIRKKDPINFPDWADKHFYLPPKSSGIPGEWETIPFQRGIMLVMGSDEVREVTLQKPARVGYTKMLSAFVVNMVENKKRSTAVWQPVQSDADGYVQDEIDPLFEYVEVFRDALIPDYRKDKDPRNTNSRKEFEGATLHILPGKSANSYRRITLDTAILDELDAFDHNIKGSDGKNEGSPTSLARVRLTASPFKKIIKGSTPTIAGASLIEAEIRDCEVVLERYVKCPHCKDYQTMEWGGPDADHGVKFVGNDHKTARYMCKHCASLLEYSDLDYMDSHGYWASDTVWLDDTDDGVFKTLTDSTVVDTPENIGFIFNTLVSPMFSWSEMTKEFIEASKSAKMGDKTKLQTFWNTRLGLCFEIYESSRLDPNMFLPRREPYASEVPLPCVALSAGVDIQGDRIEVQINGYARGEECYAIAHEVIIGNTSEMPIMDEGGKVRRAGAPETVWCKLFDLLKKRWQHETGYRLPITIACIDSGYCTTEVYHFCRREPTTFIPVKGSSTAGHPMVSFPAKRNTTGVFLTTVGGDNLQDALHTRYEIIEDGPGKMHWPLRNVDGGESLREDFNLNYFTQMTAETRIRKMANGRPVLTWVCPPNTANEATDLNKYNLAAIRIAQDFKGVNLNVAFVVEDDSYRVEQSEVTEDFSELATMLNR